MTDPLTHPGRHPLPPTTGCGQLPPATGSHPLPPATSRRRLLGAGALALAPIGALLAPSHQAHAATAQAPPGGTPGVDLPPRPQPPRPVRLPPIVEQRLPNGLTLLLVPQPGLPLVHLALQMRAGPELNGPGQAGVAEMTAGLLAKGARRGGRQVGGAELARQAEALGATLNTGCSWASSSLSMTVSRPRVDAALALMADAWRQPLLSADELSRARDQALDGLRVSFSDPGELGRMVLRRSYWGSSPYGGVTTPAALQRMGVAAVQRFHATWYRPERCALVMAGDVQPDAALALATRLLGHWEGSANARPGSAAPALEGEPFAQPEARPQPRTPPLVLVDLPGSGQSSVRLAAPFVGNRADDRVVGLVADAVLGLGYSSRMNQEVRIKRGLSYGAGSGVELHRGAGQFSAGAQTNHPTAAQVLQILRDELLRLADAPPGADELAARQATLVGSFGRQLETVSGLAGMVANQWLRGRPLDDLSRHVEQVLAVTPQQVSDFARRHWTADGVRAVVVGDLAAAGDSLQALAADRRAFAGVLRLAVPTLDLESAGLLRGG